MTTSLPQEKSRQSTAVTPAATHPEPFWRSLFYFNVYRLLIASGIVVITWLSPESSFGSYNPQLFLYTALAYIVFGGISLLLTRMQRLYFDRQLAKLEKESIIEVLKKTKYNRTAAARLLGITVRSMRYRMEQLGLNDDNG